MSVAVKLSNDRAALEKVAPITIETVDTDLRDLIAYAYHWGEAHEKRSDPPLSFSSMLAAMAASETALGHWFQRYLGLRGVKPATLTRAHPAKLETLPEGPLQTTESFRTAFEVARALWKDGGAIGALAARHFVAAYAVCPGYHLADFLRLRIDRRAWCLELADYLANEYPAESAAWKRYSELATAIPVLAFNSDAPEGRDLLNVDREVEAFARLIVARTTLTPLSIGVFGAWGSGKSFFMQRVRARVAELSATAEKQGIASPYHARVAQISFNAWHYSEGKLIPCLVDHIFKNLRFTDDEDDATLRARGAELLVQIDRAKQDLAGREQSLDEATARTNAAEQHLAEVEAQYPAAVAKKQREIEAAQAAQATAAAELARASAAQAAAIEEARASAPVHVGFALFRSDISDPKLSAAAKQITDLIDEAKSIGTKWIPILLGVLALGIGMVATQLLGSALWARITSVAASIGSFAAIATGWLHKLDGIAARGQDFQTKIKDYADSAQAKVEAAHKPRIDALAAVVETRNAEVARLNDERQALAAEAGTSKEQLARFDGERTLALAARDQAAAALAGRQQALASLSTGTLLGEFIVDRASTDSYSSLLTILSRVRNDFERLSKLMARATDDYYRGKPAPPVSRIVLYIDDLDRCPQDKVIEVLQVVHLLLAFPLFVCVVAVDPRWVTACLDNAPGVFGAHHHHTTDDADLGERAEPADYLEKIFQIPLWLRPVPTEQRAEVVRALLDPTGVRGAAHHDARTVNIAVATPSAPPILAGTPLHLAADPGEQGDGASTRDGTDLEIDAVELAYLDKIVDLLSGNPRGLKRFVNTYRLVKSALSDVELQVFRSRMRMQGTNHGDVRYLPYRMCMAQLAVLCTQRKRALKMVQLADATQDGAELTEFLSKLEAHDPELAIRLRDAVDGSTPAAVTVETFKLWLERTRRYSFYV